MFTVAQYIPVRVSTLAAPRAFIMASLRDLQLVRADWIPYYLFYKNNQTFRFGILGDWDKSFANKEIKNVKSTMGWRNEEHGSSLQLFLLFWYQDQEIILQG